MITAHFYGGPADGVIRQVTNPSWRIYGAGVDPVSLADALRTEAGKIEPPPLIHYVYERLERIQPELIDYSYRYVGERKDP
jgi:hypothetical protein